MERLQKLSKLVEISRHLNRSVDLDAYLQRIIDAACALTDSEACFVFLIEEDTGLLKCIAALRSHREVMRRLRVPVEKSAAGIAFSQSRPVLISDANVDPRIYREIERELNIETTSLIAVPLAFREKTIGVLEAVNKRGPTHYTEEDVTFLEVLGSYAAAGIFNALLMEETQNAYKDLDELERLKSNFIAIASHELRTPLSLILGHANALYSSIRTEAERKQVQTILSSAMRLEELIDDMSRFTEKQADEIHLHKEAVQVGQLVDEACRSFESLARRERVALTASIPPGNLTLLCDVEKIQTALNNVIKNAITYTQTNGHVRVVVEKLPGYAKISVIDDGVGISPKDLPHIFDRFFQAESHFTRRHGGMGLGLSIAKVMIELHDGQIWAESVEGKGSKFTILLPTRSEETRPEKKVFIT